MTYEIAEPLSAAKLESAMVDTGPQKLHDGAGVGQTSTKNPEEPLFLTHSSDLISTYYSTGDVYFIDQSSGAHNQAHRLSDINDKHHEVASLIGQNLGLFAVGKKIVFVEGEESSIDRLTYQKIAQTVNADIRVIPTGSVLNILALNQDFHFGSWPPRFYVHSLLKASLS